MAAEPDQPSGSLTIAGAGIRPGLHATRESIARIRSADKVLYLLAEITPITWLEELNPSAESLDDLYQADRPFAEVYEDIVARILDHVRKPQEVCVVFYGHPSVFDRTSHEAVRRARAEGFEARILPGSPPRIVSTSISSSTPVPRGVRASTRRISSFAGERPTPPSR